MRRGWGAGRALTTCRAAARRAAARHGAAGGGPGSPDIAARIDRLAWWNFSREMLFEAVSDMQAMAVEAFLVKWEGRE